MYGLTIKSEKIRTVPEFVLQGKPALLFVEGSPFAQIFLGPSSSSANPVKVEYRFLSKGQTELLSGSGDADTIPLNKEVKSMVSWMQAAILSVVELYSFN